MIKQYTENNRLTNKNPTKNQKWTQVLWCCKQFLFRVLFLSPIRWYVIVITPVDRGKISTWQIVIVIACQRKETVLSNTNNWKLFHICTQQEIIPCFLYGILSAMPSDTDWTDTLQEEFENTIGVIRIRKLKDRQHNSQKKKYKRTNKDLENIHIKLKFEKHDPLQTGVNSGAPEG